MNNGSPPPGTRLVPLTAQEVRLAATLNAEAVSDAPTVPLWTIEDLLIWLDLPGVRGWLALVDEKPAGWLLVRRTGDETEILTIAVHPRARRRGIARHLIEYTARAAARCGARRLVLEVSAEAPGALALYRATGFEKIGRRAGYYTARGRDDRVDAFVLERVLVATPPQD